MWLELYTASAFRGLGGGFCSCAPGLRTEEGNIKNQKLLVTYLGRLRVSWGCLGPSVLLPPSEADAITPFPKWEVQEHWKQLWNSNPGFLAENHSLLYSLSANVEDPGLPMKGKLYKETAFWRGFPQWSGVGQTSSGEEFKDHQGAVQRWAQTGSSGKSL